MKKVLLLNKPANYPFCFYPFVFFQSIFEGYGVLCAKVLVVRKLLFFGIFLDRILTNITRRFNPVILQIAVLMICISTDMQIKKFIAYYIGFIVIAFDRSFPKKGLRFSLYSHRRLHGRAIRLVVVPLLRR